MLFILSLILVQLQQVLAASTVTDQSMHKPTWAELAHCKPHPSHEELVARREAEKANISDQELLARLIFSEALSTGYWREKCEASSSRFLMESIGWGIMNRIHSRISKRASTPFYDVIFQKNQFRTSFSGKRENPFAKSFLCPLQAQDYLNHSKLKIAAIQLFIQSLEVSENLISEYKKQGIPNSFREISHFFYPNSEFFGEIRPPWARNKDPKQNTGYIEIFDKQKPCVEFYRLD